MSNYRTIKNYNSTSDAEQRLNNARQQLAPEYWRDEEATSIVPKRTNNFVAPDKQAVVRQMPDNQFAPHNTVQQIVNHNVDPITRTIAIVSKTALIGVFLALLTIGAMVMFSEFYFFAWLMWASIEFLGSFVYVCVLDYREQPAALNRHFGDRYLDMMEREHTAWLIATYPDQEF